MWIAVGSLSLFSHLCLKQKKELELPKQMEGSGSEAVFDSFDLKPQLFINETLNRVDELVDGGFSYFNQEASRLLKIDGSDKSEDLKMGINYIRNAIQETMDKRLSMWEKYCLHHCFAVPPGFSLPFASGTSGDDPMDHDDVSEEQVDAQLDVLRKKLAVAGKECADLNQELQELERKSAMSDQCASSINDAVQLYETSSAHDMYQEMLGVASELHQKMEQLKSKQKEEIARDRKGRVYNPNGNLLEMNCSKGLTSLKLDELQGFIAETGL